MGCLLGRFAVPVLAEAGSSRVWARMQAAGAALEPAGADGRRLRAAGAVAVGAAGAWAPFLPDAAGRTGAPGWLAVEGGVSPIVQAGCWVALWVLMACALQCDLAFRVIPREACWAMALLGAALQAVRSGGAGVAAGCLFAFGTTALCSGLNRVARWRIRRKRTGRACEGEGRGAERLGCDAARAWGDAQGSPATCDSGASCMVGGGDVRCMAALSVASGFAAPAGFAACFLAAAVVALAKCAMGKARAGDAMPLAPYLCVWLWVGAGL